MTTVTSISKQNAIDAFSSLMSNCTEPVSIFGLESVPANMLQTQHPHVFNLLMESWLRSKNLSVTAAEAE